MPWHTLPPIPATFKPLMNIKTSAGLYVLCAILGTTPRAHERSQWKEHCCVLLQSAVWDASGRKQIKSSRFRSDSRNRNAGVNSRTFENQEGITKVEAHLQKFGGTLDSRGTL